MALEIEAKFKVDSHEPMRAALQQVGARCRGLVIETNQIFDDAKGSLHGADSGLRIRTCRYPEGKIVSATMTYKGPRSGSELKEREEIEFWIDDPKRAKALLEALGYAEILCFEKRRETWRIEDCSVELDELPTLGPFVEIEASTEQAVRDLAPKLGLSDSSLLRETYISLLIRHCDENKLPRQVLF